MIAESIIPSAEIPSAEIPSAEIPSAVIPEAMIPESVISKTVIPETLVLSRTWQAVFGLHENMIARMIAHMTAFAVVLWACVFMHAIPADAAEPFELHLLDVGQGQSVLVEADGHYMLIDGGGRSSSSFVVSYLQQMGITNLDYVAVSHYDEDHMSGEIGVLHVFSAGQILLPSYAGEGELYQSFATAAVSNGADIIHPQMGESFQLGGATVQVVGPARSDYDLENDRSLAFRIVYGETSCLICGDSEQQAETDMVNVMANGMSLQNTDGVSAGQQNIDGVNAGQQNTDGVNAGQQNTDGVNAGQQNTDGVNAGQQNTDGVNAGQQNTDGVNAGQQNIDGINDVSILAGDGTNAQIKLGSDVYIVNHHGSGDSTTDYFLDAVAPSYALISCGSDNTYGHPAESTLQRLKTRGINMFRTDKQGTVILYSDGITYWFSQEPCQDWTPGTYLPAGTRDISGTAINTNGNGSTSEITPSGDIDNAGGNIPGGDGDSNGGITPSGDIDNAGGNIPGGDGDSNGGIMPSGNGDGAAEASSGGEETGNYNYVCNTNTRKFHYPSCSSVSQMNESNRMYTSLSRDELIAQGYKPCGNCNP